MVNNKIVKSLTQVLIFSFCCFFCIGGMPIYAEVPEFSTDGARVYMQCENSNGAPVDIPAGFYLSRRSFVDTSGWIEDTPISSSRFENIYNVSTTNYNDIDIKVTIPTGYLLSCEIVYYDLDGTEDQTRDIVVSTDSNNPSKIIIHTLNSTPSQYTDIYFTLIPISDGQLQPATQYYFVVHESLAGEIVPDEPDAPNVDLDSFLRLFTDPVGALFNMELVPGITLGGVFSTIVGISLFIWFLKLFSGG